MKTASPGPTDERNVHAHLTRQQLQELEEREKSPLRKALDLAITLLPLAAGVGAILEYQLLPDSFANPKPGTYLGFLALLVGLYGLSWLWGTAVLAVKKDRQGWQKTLYCAPLYTVLFLLLAAYDYLTLKTSILTQPFVPCVNSIMNAAWTDRSMLLTSAAHTLRLMFIGYFIGVALGLVTGITCGYSRRVRYWVDPVLKFLGPIPTSTWIPIIMVVAGSLFGGAIFIIALGSWFAVTVASMTGVSNVDKDYFEAAKTLGASERQMVFRVAIPHAMPNILQGMTQALSTACTAIMVAEMMGVKAGLGWYITWAKSWASYDKMFAALFVICMIFTFVTKALNMVKKYALRWQVGMVK